jgi:hypothetical protein
MVFCPDRVKLPAIRSNAVVRTGKDRKGRTPEEKIARNGKPPVAVRTIIRKKNEVAVQLREALRRRALCRVLTALSVSLNVALI